MRLYKPPVEPDLIRINITKYGHLPEHIAVEGIDIDGCIAVVKEILIKQGFNPFPEGNFANIACRESNAGENGKAKSFKVYNLSPAQIKQYIIKYLENLNEE